MKISPFSFTEPFETHPAHILIFNLSLLSFLFEQFVHRQSFRYLGQLPLFDKRIGQFLILLFVLTLCISYLLYVILPLLLGESVFQDGTWVSWFRHTSEICGDFCVLDLIYVAYEEDSLCLFIEVNQMEILLHSFGLLHLYGSSHHRQSDILVFNHGPLFPHIGFFFNCFWAVVEHRFSGFIVFFHFLHLMVVLIWIPQLGFQTQLVDDSVFLFEIG